MLKRMNVGDWVTPSARGKEHWWRVEGGGADSFREWGFYDDMIGVIIERKYNTRDSIWEYTIMWTNADITKRWTREKLKYARVKR